ncbi:hypothetical protein [Herbaspirillum huttiense]|uniref:hypothetical protein n=1 Tax=Herbaspirillum huttiense TaxID=863372 RepID=UPI00217695C8|nr:hypothetical protein [Herbaspirillum huttiense]UWE16079.1 hypothetical protein NY669_23850 [Herbaspirillum huttiense]
MPFPHATALTPSPSEDWTKLSDSQRLDRIKSEIAERAPIFNEQLTALAARADGQVIVRLLQPAGPAERGTLLLDYEDLLKQGVDEGITVWGESLGDKNSLRNLRGIEVKS